MKGMLNFIFFILIAYLGWDYYSYSSDPMSELGTRRSALEQKQVDIATKEKKIADAKTFSL
jgi:hypothetical protein